MNPAYGIVLFHTTSAAMQAERAVQHAGIEQRMIPTPREFSSDCGIALRFLWNDAPAVANALETAQVELAGLHAMTDRESP